MPESQEKYDVCVVGSCIADFISYVPFLPRISETVKGKSFESGFGGKGANQCVAATKLGSTTTMVAKLGQDPWGQNYKDYLDKLGVGTSGLMLVDGLILQPL